MQILNPQSNSGDESRIAKSIINTSKWGEKASQFNLDCDGILCTDQPESACDSPKLGVAKWKTLILSIDVPNNQFYVMLNSETSGARSLTNTKEMAAEIDGDDKH